MEFGVLVLTREGWPGGPGERSILQADITSRPPVPVFKLLAEMPAKQESFCFFWIPFFRRQAFHPKAFIAPQVPTGHIDPDLPSGSKTS